MIVGADPRVRNAFRATLRDEPSNASLVSTAEIDPADILEVTDLATAIARAEQVIRDRASGPRVVSAAPSSSGGRDIFDALVTDESGMQSPYRPTPVPAAPPTPIPLPPQALAQSRRSTLLAPNGGQPMPAMPSAPAAARSAPILVLDQDAFYHPAGRIRGLADDMLEGYRPESTLMVRLRQHRSAIAWLAVAVCVPLTFLALFAVAVQFGRMRVARAGVATSTMSTTKRAQPIPVAPPPSATPTKEQGAITPAVPVLDVKSLKSVPPSTQAR